MCFLHFSYGDHDHQSVGTISSGGSIPKPSIGDYTLLDNFIIEGSAVSFFKNVASHQHLDLTSRTKSDQFPFGLLSKNFF